MVGMLRAKLKFVATVRKTPHAPQKSNGLAFAMPIGQPRTISTMAWPIGGCIPPAGSWELKTQIARTIVRD